MMGRIVYYTSRGIMLNSDFQMSNTISPPLPTFEAEEWEQHYWGICIRGDFAFPTIFKNKIPMWTAPFNEDITDTQRSVSSLDGKNYYVVNEKSLRAPTLKEYNTHFKPLLESKPPQLKPKKFGGYEL